LFRSFGGHFHRLDTSGAELELRDLAEWVELRIGEQVRCSLGEAERDEHHPFRNVPVRSRLELHLAATRRDTDELARSNAEALHLSRMEAGNRLGLQRVELAGASGHGPRVPM